MVGSWLEWGKNLAGRAWQWLRAHWAGILTALLGLFMAAGVAWSALRYTPAEEMALRNAVVKTAEVFLGCNEADGSHAQIVNIYNSHQPRPRDYEVTYEDSWCAVFASAVAMQTRLLDYIPPECSCGQQIQLFQQLGRWEERDWYLPKPGDYIYYDWNCREEGDCTGWPEHVGIVVKTVGPAIQVIEGNKDDCVCYRYLFINDPTIRGYGLPDYAAASRR